MYINSFNCMVLKHGMWSWQIAKLHCRLQNTLMLLIHESSLVNFVVNTYMYMTVLDYSGQNRMQLSNRVSLKKQFHDIINFYYPHVVVRNTKQFLLRVSCGMGEDGVWSNIPIVPHSWTSAVTSYLALMTQQPRSSMTLPGTWGYRGKDPQYRPTAPRRWHSPGTQTGSRTCSDTV